MAKRPVEPRPIFPLHKNRKRCIGCAFLCWGYSDDFKEMKLDDRQDIIEGKAASSIFCYKWLITDMSQRIMHNPKCPKNEWHPYINFMSPEISLRNDHHRRTRRLAMTAIIVSAIVLLTTIAFGIMNLLN